MSSKHGFAGMSPEKRSEISRKGGKAAHKLGKAHVFTVAEARIAGMLGGHAVSRDKEHMAEIGRKGGQAKGKKSKK